MLSMPVVNLPSPRLTRGNHGLDELQIGGLIPGDARLQQAGAPNLHFLGGKRVEAPNHSFSSDCPL